MKAGITYDLQDYYLASGMSEEETAEFDRPETIDAIEKTLRDLGYETDPVGNIFDLTKRLAAGDKWDIVFNIAEGTRGFGREAQIPALLDAYGIPYTFSDPLVLSLALHKGMTKHVIKNIGVPTPDFHVIEHMSDLDNVSMAFPLFAKPVAEGTGKGIGLLSRINSRAELNSSCRQLLDKFRQPVILERFLPGREFTVGITGTGKKAEAIGAIEIALHGDAEPDSYSYSNKKKFEGRVMYTLVDDAEAQMAMDTALAAWRGLGCRDGGRVDLRSDENNVPMFIEVNPLAGINPEISDLPILCGMKGISYRELITRIMDSALERVASDKNTQ